MTVQVSIGFSRSRNIGSKIIRFFTRSNISHAFLILRDSFLGIDMVLEAVPGGFQLITLAAFDKNHEIVHIIPLENLKESAVKKATQWLGRRYDYFGVFGTLFVLVGRWLRLRWSNPFNTKAIFCSEALVIMLQASNYPGSDALEPSSVTPADLYAFLKKN